MAKISLRAYLREIENLIEKSQIDEALAHCRQILTFYPKNLGTYRMLGKAFLDCQRYTDAGDIFSRVLSSVPDDFVSQVGMSIIREDEGNLDSAIWHMERAFEVQPYNSAIQDELRRLYGRRDGLEPPKVRLTRGALARMYAKGDLYQQAIGELRGALAESPQRPDLKVVLARMYYMTGQRVEAVEICSSLLKKLPYCLEANRIIGAILPDTERKEESQLYLQKVLALDPYLAQVSAKEQNADSVPDQSVMLDHLDYQPGISPVEGTEKPAWAASLGVSFQPFAQSEESLPDWLSTQEEGKTPFIFDDEAGGTKSKPAFEEFPWGQEQEPQVDIEFGGVVKENDSERMNSAAAETPSEEDLIPDWMQAAGWQPSHGEGEVPASFFEGEITADGLAKGDIPDWLKAMAPPEAAEDFSAVSGEYSSEVEPLPWLEEAPLSGDTVANWLNGLEADDTSVLPAEADAGEAAVGDIPDWLKDLEPAPSVQVEAEGAPMETPDWLQELPTEIIATPASEIEIEESSPDWLQELAADSGAPASPEETEDDTADWLKSLEIGDTVEQAPLVEAEDIEPSIPVEDQEGSQEPVKELSEDEALLPEELPEWISEFEAEKSQALEEETAAESLSVEEPGLFQVESLLEGDGAISEISLDDENAMMAWLENLAAKQGVSEEELITKPEDRLEAPPDWLKQDIQVEAEIESGEGVAFETSEADNQVEAVTEWLHELAPEDEEGAAEAEASVTGDLVEAETIIEGIPDWLLEVAPVEEALTGEDILEEVEEEAVEAEYGDIPDWLRTPAPVEEAFVVEEAPVPSELEETHLEPEEEVLQGESSTSAVSGMSLEDEDAMMAWLENLAARQGVAEEELLTRPEDRRDTPPDWVQKEAEREEAGQEADDEAELSVTAQETAIETETVGLPDAEFEVGIEEETTEEAPVEEAVVSEEKEVEELPDWLLAETVIQQPVIEDLEVPAWLETIEPGESVASLPEETHSVLVEPEIEAAVDIISEEITPIPGSISGMSLEDEDAMMAWLETLAARQGASEEELLTRPEDRRDTPPDWVQEDIQKEAEAEAIPVETPAEPILGDTEPVRINPLPADEHPATEEIALMDSTAQEVIEEEPQEASVIEETQPDLPAWLADIPAATEEDYSWMPPDAEQEIQEAPLAVEEAPGILERVQRLNANTASLVELESLPGVGFRLAQQIIEYRQMHGPFQHIEELGDIPDLDPAELSELSARLFVPEAPATPVQAASIQDTPGTAEAERNILLKARTAMIQGKIPETIELYGELIRKEQLLSEVIKDLQDALYRYPVDVNIWQILGDAFMSNNQLQDALEAYIKAEELLR